MGIVVKFRRHATSRSRAAKAARSSAVTPASIARGRAKITDHQSAAILLRCHHLLTKRESHLKPAADISSAKASRDGHRSITAWNDPSSDMEISLRQTVLKCKPILSQDLGIAVGQNVLMGDDPAASEFKRLFIARTALARERADYTQESMAEALGVKQTKYHKYEVRSLMPHYLILRFCALCRITPEWLYAAAVELPVAVKRRRKARRKRAA
jgi:DNA-binding XRE family transcriptional regulator